MDNRIQYQKTDKKLEIVIKAYCNKQKQKVLLVWLILFSLCGIAILSQFFDEYDNGTKVFFAVYVAFWLFFEFKVIYAYRWRKYGEEKVIVEEKKLYLVKTIGTRGITQIYQLDEIKKIDFFKDKKIDFVKSMNNSYWNINKYQLFLQLEKSKVPFAIDVEYKDAKKVLNELRNFIK